MSDHRSRGGSDRARWEAEQAKLARQRRQQQRREERQARRDARRLARALPLTEVED